jgi:biofilm PGA synthesis N-glycosyltransferase PgaC
MTIATTHTTTVPAQDLGREPASIAQSQVPVIIPTLKRTARRKASAASRTTGGTTAKPTSTEVAVWTPPASRPAVLSPGERFRLRFGEATQNAARAFNEFRYRESIKGTATGRLLVLVPAHDEADTIGSTLIALNKQTRRPDRIVVVADNCTDDTAEIARRHGAVVMETIGNRDRKTGALIQAWEKHHRGFEFIAGVDADTILDPGTFEFLETELREDRGTGGVMARYSFTQGKSGLLVQLQRAEFSSWTADLLAKKRNTYVLGGQCSMFRASALLKVAEQRHGVPWDTGTLVEDMQLTGDLLALGYRTTVHAEARAYAGAMHSLKALWAQRMKWDQGATRLVLTTGLNRWTAILLKQQLSLMFNGFTRLMFAIILTASLAVGKFGWQYYWLAPPIIAVILNIKNASKMPNRRKRDMIAAALLVPTELYLIFRATSMTIATVKVLSGSRSDGWAAQKKAEKGGGMSFTPKILAFIILIIGCIYGTVAAWQQLPGQWQDVTLSTSWHMLGVITVLQCVFMLKRIFRRSHGMNP